MLHTPARKLDAPAFDTQGASSVPGLSVYCGIVSGFLQSYATAWGTTPAAVLDAIERTGIRPMVDTAQAANNRETHTRPDDPARRCLAFQEADVRQLARELSADRRGDAV
jgi:hypothetical protein